LLILHLGVAGLAVLHGAGGRELVGVLSGTMRATEAELGLGVGYVVAWFASVLVAPIVALALALEAACGKIAAGLLRWRAFRRR
jgi:hypothetical protein